jgi:hypothetical protein
MGQVYILRLRGKKWYVGYTDRSITRVLEHAQKKGAKWTKKHPPLKNYLYEMSSPDHTLEDEDRITLSLMAEHGIENVRGGSWCMVKMYHRTVKELEGHIKKSRPKKGQTCDRCGRDSHARSKCYAGTTVDGVTITTKSWKYRPKAKSKERDPRRRKSKGDKKAKRTYNRYRKGGRKGQR